MANAGEALWAAMKGQRAEAGRDCCAWTWGASTMVPASTALRPHGQLGFSLPTGGHP
jgi:hypothetical protein